MSGEISVGQKKNFTYSSALKQSSDDEPVSLSSTVFSVSYLKEPSTDYIFASTTIFKESDIYIFDILGNVIFHQIVPGYDFNFKPQDSGVLTYFSFKLKGFVVLDKYYRNIDTLTMANGYVPDMHEMLIQNNGDRWMMAHPLKSLDLTNIGGNANVTVKGLVIQKLSKDDQLLFEWESWDHYKITDTYLKIEGAATLDYVHGNSIDVDSDTSIIISCRNLNEVSKIDTRTGEFIWRLGGKNNQFELINDPTGFSGQHSAKKLDNGNLIMYDNRIEDSIQGSRGAQYKLDEKNYTLTLVKEYIHNPPYFASVTGNIQRLENNNIFIFWGAINEDYTAFSEYDSTGALTYDAETLPLTSFDNKLDYSPIFNYRVYRSKWESSVFQKEIDTLSFNQGVDGQADIKKFRLTNNSGNAIKINYISIKAPQFSITDSLPIQIEAGGSYLFNISFRANKAGNFEDIINLGYQTETTLISTQLYVKGSSSFINTARASSSQDVKVYPNPFVDHIYIKGISKIIRASIYDLNGKIVFDKDLSGQEVELSVDKLPAGIYLLRIINSDYSLQRKLLFKAE